MIPIRDSVRPRTRPLVSWALIVLNTWVFLQELALTPRQLILFFERYGLVASDFWNAAGLVERFGPMLTSMFVHVGWVHFFGNMLFLWVFGDNVEDRMGRLRFLTFYLLSGAAAALAQLWINPASTIPMIGASGAIAGVLGAYLRMFPRARVVAVVPIFLFWQITEVPAMLFLAFWFFIQLASGALSLVAMQAAAGGPAFFAHIGGFVAGFVLCPLFVSRRTVEILGPW